VAALPGSWRAQLWLARAALKAGDYKSAVAFYNQGLSQFGAYVPADFLMQMSGDLGQSGHMQELLELTKPRYVPETHGLAVGNNLIKACLDLGQVGAAKEILNKLHSLARPDWKRTLGFWDTELANRRIAASEG
jgi:hypothetical protein